MKQWSIRFEVASGLGKFTQDQAESLLEVLGPHAPAVSYSPRTLSARFCVDADAYERAAKVGSQTFRSALSKLGIAQNSVVEVECQLMEDLNRSIEESNAPELVGVAELAAALKTSKQRASELARSPEFPRPVADLASGPVWRWSAVLRYVKTWSRRPGRPKQVLPVVARFATKKKA